MIAFQGDMMKIFKVMLLVLLLQFPSFVFSEGLSEQPMPTNAIENIQITISDQIAAFRQNDVKRAYSYASTFIKNIFPDAESFGEMVKKSYPMIWDPIEYRFLESRVEGGYVFQRVLFVDNQKKVHLFDYVMLLNLKTWSINGVYFVSSGDQGA